MNQVEPRGARPTILLRAKDAARALAISEKTLWTLSAPRGPIPTVRIGERSIRYSVAALQRWIEADQTAAATNGEVQDEQHGGHLLPVPLLRHRAEVPSCDG
jgi:predicted DNA-binding transcriptional regulator AlpA